MFFRAAIYVVFMLSLIGCDVANLTDAQSTLGRDPQVASIPDPKETVRGDQNLPVVTLPVGKKLRERRLARTEALPQHIHIPVTNLSAVPVTAALQAVLDGTDVSLSWESGTFDDRLVSVANLSGSLSDVVTKICQAAKIFCSYRGGLLEMKDEETFIVELPSMPFKKEIGTTSSGAANSMVDTIKTLIKGDVHLDEQGGNLIYTATVTDHEKVQEYLTQLRHGRPLIVMQLYIWEVVLNKENATGINWDSFSIGKMHVLGQDIALSGLTTFTNMTSPGVSLGATTTGIVDSEAMLNFLATKGVVQTISNPQLTFISGSSAEFRVGGEKRYISQVGELTSTSVSGTSSSGVGTNTITTDSIETGLTVDINGSFENGVISAYLTVEIQDIVSLNPTETQGLTIDLPETSERKVETTLRVRPGDNLVLAGLVSSRDEDDREGISTFFGTIPSFSSDILKNTELVLLVKPAVVVFADTGEDKIDGVAPEKKQKISKRSPDLSIRTQNPIKITPNVESKKLPSHIKFNVIKETPNQVKPSVSVWIRDEDLLLDQDPSFKQERR